MTSLPIRPPYPPMEAKSVEQIPTDTGYQFEPKWDGFRCLAFRDGEEIELQSKAGQPLARYFPDVVDNIRGLAARRFVLDGELVIPRGPHLSFDDLLLRIHPAASRVRKLAGETPAIYIVFDLLVDDHGRLLAGEPLRTRRAKLEQFASKYFAGHPGLRLSPATGDPREAARWLRGAGGALDGVVAKRCDLEYRSGDRTGMVKVKLLREADCVVGGFRYATRGRTIGSLLLGLYDDRGLLDHVGFCSSLDARRREELTPRLEALVEPPGFTGAAPGGPSRWSKRESDDWRPLAPRIVVEVQYDHFSGGRFRHGTKFLRMRPDKDPRQCTMEQVERHRTASPLKLTG